MAKLTRKILRLTCLILLVTSFLAACTSAHDHAVGYALVLKSRHPFSPITPLEDLSHQYQ